MADPAPAPAPDAAVPLAPVPVAVEVPVESWSPLRRAAFRFVFCFAVLLYFPFPLGFLPFSQVVSEPIESAHNRASIWLADKLFHPPPEELPEQTGSGDTLWAYVQVGASLAFALVAAAVWTALDRRREQYRTLAAWFEFCLRWALFYVMAGYGFAKVFPHQMPWDAGRLVEPMGEFSPMGLVWTFMGFSPAYEALAGWGEVIGAVLLVWRRTAGAGALLLLGVMGNVVAINYLYDVPVKLFSTQLWLTGLYIAAPDLKRLFRLLVLRRPTEPAADVPLLRWALVRRHRWIGPAVMVALTGMTLFGYVWGGFQFEGRLREMAAKAPLTGAWQVESFTPPVAAGSDSLLLGPAWARVSGSLLRLGVLRADGSYFGARATPQPDGTVKLEKPRSKESAVVRIERLDAEHARISGEESFEVKLKAIPDSSFTLLRGFHWVQANPVNR